MEKSCLAQFIEAKLQGRRENKASILSENPSLYLRGPRARSPHSYRAVIASLSDRERFAYQQRMYQMSGATSSRDVVRFDPHAHGVADGH